VFVNEVKAPFGGHSEKCFITTGDFVQIEFKKVSAAYSEELSDVIQMHLVIRKL
jgi:hypothetical protein